MSVDNVLMNVKVTINCDENGPIKPATELSTVLENEEYLYSYFIRAMYKDGQIDKFIVQIAISQTERYNTIHKNLAILEIVNLLSKEYSESVKIVGYRQPPLDLLVEILDPLVTKLATQQHQRWGVEYDDLVQICRLTLCILYNKGYYIHKSLLTTAFIRDVLKYLRHDKDKPTVVSFEDLTNNPDSPNSEQIADDKAEEQITAYEEEEHEADEFAKKKRLAIKHFGERKYNQLLLGVKSGTLSNSDCAQIFRASKKLKRRLKHDS